MPSLFCAICEGEGMAPVLYCNHGTRTLHKRLISCPKCNKHENPEEFKKEGEEILDVTIDVQSLISNGGYRYV